jgi:hypothetical protein
MYHHKLGKTEGELMGIANLLRLLKSRRAEAKRMMNLDQTKAKLTFYKVPLKPKRPCIKCPFLSLFLHR